MSRDFLSNNPSQNADRKAFFGDLPIMRSLKRAEPRQQVEDSQGFFLTREGLGSRDRTYAEPSVGRLAGSIAASGRILSGFPDRTSEPGPNSYANDFLCEIVVRHAQGERR